MKSDINFIGLAMRGRNPDQNPDDISRNPQENSGRQQQQSSNVSTLCQHRMSRVPLCQFIQNSRNTQNNNTPIQQ